MKKVGSLMVVLVLGAAGLFYWKYSMKDGQKFPTVKEADLKGVVRTTFDSPNPSKSQLARRARSIAIIKKMEIPVVEGLPVVEDESAVEPRSAEDIARRCVAVAICAVKGETGDQELTKELIATYAIGGDFTPKERAFVDKLDPGKQEEIDFAWGYERSHVLLWALGYVQELKPPNEICDVPGDMKLIKGKSVADLVSHARLRSMGEVLDMADLYYRLDWAAVELRVKNRKSDRLDEGIIRERHYALNWLIRYMHQTWDGVKTDT